MSDSGFFSSTVGKKYLMGISGLVWAGFILGHMAGNFLIFLGPDMYNSYGHAIVSNKILLYGTEGALIWALFTHVVLAINLTLHNRKSRPRNYATTTNGAKAVSWASRTMAIHGTIILIFIITHLTTFKYGTNYETAVGGVPMRDLYRLVVEIFQQPGYVAWYVVSLILLGFHLRHGIGSIFQSFGILDAAKRPLIKKIQVAYSAIVAAGFLAQPIYVYFFAN